MQVVQLLVSPLHRFSGRPTQGPSADPVGGLVQQIRVRRHLGIVGDRYFAQRAHRDAAVTIMAEENLPTSIDPTVDLQKTRRNILLRGIDIDAYVDWTVELDTGDGPIAFAVNRAARPCAWMDTLIGPGAQRALRGKGGVRCTPLSDGVLRVGRASFQVVGPRDWR
ncbi:molybdenum cofactor biosysynthesis protein (plasmid) [Streptomyces sp. NBC_01136]|uniref:molybdenum cofactor biosysynthesis protein n=2 Tax=unclassified Streptomyces TaxID=2593676 RepID=UPI002F91480D|nr:molybdenum cofactor biosysynthesis protein [Streptomyces sp. NBC_01136]